VVKVSDGSVIATSSYYPASDALVYATSISIGTLAAGTEYRIEYYINATPDITGYTEGWFKTLIQFYAPSVSDSDIDIIAAWPQKIYAVQVSVQGGEFLSRTSVGESRAQYVQIAPLSQVGDFQPEQADVDEDVAMIVTPWVKDNPSPVSGGGYPYLGAVCTWWNRRDGFWDIYHYQPWAYSGTPPAVIAAIAMQAGLSASWIDQTLFSDADDSYTNDAPWSSLSAVPVLYAARKIGRTVADLVYEVARHTRDLLAVTMIGKLAVVSRTDPPTLATLAYTDGVVAVEWGVTVGHLFNSVVARFCGGYAQSGDDSNDPLGTGTFACNEEVNLDSHPGDKWDVTGDNAASQAKYGVVTLPGTKRSTIVSGAIKERTVASYPLWLDSAVGSALLTHWLPMDAQPRRELRVRQTFLGLDYDVGTRIDAVTLTGDGGTIANMFCIEKEIDFDDLRVDSILLEDPSL
jgi:hypothetical protein